jgi:hypothetical protein
MSEPIDTLSFIARIAGKAIERERERERERGGANLASLPAVSARRVYFYI